MLIDDMTIRVIAGKGGDGTVAFNKNKMALGPTGAKGGNGGSVYLIGVNDLSALNKLRHTKQFRADDGRNGGRQYNDGENGSDLVVEVPIGTSIYNKTTKKESEIIKIGEKLLVANGGHGGKGNFHFRSSTNTSPRQFQKGLIGEKFNLHLELKLIADVGLVGLPNAGKSSLLNELTNAKSKVANYPFTTLEPHLGVYYSLILADVPGIIEGASTGKGLGIKFLKHIERTGVIFHLISSESQDLGTDYDTVRNELNAYSKILLDKKEFLLLTKSDLLNKKEIKEKISKLKKINKSAIAISIHDWDSLEKIKKILNKFSDKK